MYIGVGTGGARGAMAPPPFHATTGSILYTCIAKTYQLAVSRIAEQNAAPSAIGRARYTYEVASLDRPQTTHKSYYLRKIYYLSR